MFWHDTWLPSLWASLSFAAKPGSPLDPIYLARFVFDLIPVKELAGTAVVLAAFWALSRKFNLGAITVAALLLTLLKTTYAPGDWEGRLKAFHDREASRRVDMGQGAPATDFDIVIIQACSFGWDDIEASHVGRLSAIEDMDILYSSFTSAASYSGPAMARLLDAPCGQLPHDALYRKVPEDCSLVTGLEKRGYKVASALNHPGESRDFKKELSSLGKLPAPMRNDDLQAQFLNFDEAPIYSDRAVLERWWSARIRDSAPRAMLYYNTITTHGGVHRAHDPSWWKKSKSEAWIDSARTLSAELSDFFKTLDSSGRSAMVILVGEHAMAYRGTPMQGEELRDIPLPRTTMVPAGIKFIGPAFRAIRRPRRIENRPASYLCLAQDIADVLAGRDISAPPAQEFVAENERAVVANWDGHWLYRDGAGHWSALRPGEEKVLSPMDAGASRQ